MLHPPMPQQVALPSSAQEVYGAPEAEAYYNMRDGAFPTDPYSHTPWGKGAKQPGMTGQVKKELLTRLGELGLFVRHGRIHFAPTLLCDDEFLESAHRHLLCGWPHRDAAVSARIFGRDATIRKIIVAGV